MFNGEVTVQHVADVCEHTCEHTDSQPLTKGDYWRWVRSKSLFDMLKVLVVFIEKRCRGRRSARDATNLRAHYQ